MKTVLDLSNKEAYDYFMSPDNYCNIPLPPYFKFEKLLKYVAKTIGKKISPIVKKGGASG